MKKTIIVALISMGLLSACTINNYYGVPPHPHHDRDFAGPRDWDGKAPPPPAKRKLPPKPPAEDN